MNTTNFLAHWQYNGVDKWDTIVRWCYANLRGLWSASFETISFKDESDYAWFILRWGGN